MLNLQAYLDDSGKSTDPTEKVCGIGGCVAPADAWKALEPEWGKVLVDFNVAYLHMREYAHSTGAFEVGWKGDEAKRRDFLSALMDIMAHYVMATIGATVLIEDFKRLTDDQKQMMVDPHFMCMQDIFHGAALQAVFEPADEKVDLIFSEQTDYRGQALLLYQTYQKTASGDMGRRLGSFKYASFKDTIPLQAADLVAYELRAFAADLSVDRPTTTRVPLKRLFRQRHFFNFFTHNEIVKRFYMSGHRGPF